MERFKVKEGAKMSIRIYLNNEKQGNELKDRLDRCKGNIILKLPQEFCLKWERDKDSYKEWIKDSDYEQRKEVTVYCDEEEDMEYLLDYLISRSNS